MSEKKNDYLDQPQKQPELPENQSGEHFIKGSIVEYLLERGIPSRNTTLEKLGQSSLMFTNRTKPPDEDDSLGASIRYLKFKKFKP